MKRVRGFTLIELVVSLVLATIVAGFAAMFLATPVQAYLAQARRAEMSDAADMALRHLARDVGRGLPNGVRVVTFGARSVLEVIAVDAMAFYRDAAAPGPPAEGDPLSIGGDDGFELLQAALPAIALDRVVVGGFAVADAYQGTGSSTGTGGAAPDPADASRVVLTPAHSFPAHSPGRRAYFVSTVTRFECDLATGELRRWVGQPITAAVAVNAPGAGDLIARDLAACSFSFDPAAAAPGAPQHGGVLTIDMTVARNTDGNTEQLRLLRQVEVQNAP